MTTTLMMMDICCLLLVGGSLTRIRFRPLRKSGFQGVQSLGKQFAVGQSRSVICSSNSAMRCKVAGSFSPSLAVRSGLRYRLHICGTYGVRQGRDRRVHGLFHSADDLRWEGCV